MVLMNKVFQHIHSFQMVLLEIFIKINLDPGDSRITIILIRIISDLYFSQMDLGNEPRYSIYAICTSNAALHGVL